VTGTKHLLTRNDYYVIFVKMLAAGVCLKTKLTTISEGMAITDLKRSLLISHRSLWSLTQGN